MLCRLSLLTNGRNRSLGGANQVARGQKDGERHVGLGRCAGMLAALQDSSTGGHSRRREDNVGRHDTEYWSREITAGLETRESSVLKGQDAPSSIFGWYGMVVVCVCRNLSYLLFLIGCFPFVPRRLVAPVTSLLTILFTHSASFHVSRRPLGPPWHQKRKRLIRTVATEQASCACHTPQQPKQTT